MQKVNIVNNISKVLTERSYKIMHDLPDNLFIYFKLIY
jgi:hypothetical protein